MPITIADYSLLNEMEEVACVFEQIPSSAGNGLNDYRYVFVNQAFRSLFSTGDLAGQTLKDSFPGEHENWFETYNEVLSTGISKRFEQEATSQNKVIEMYLSRLDDGADKRLMNIMRDVTVQRQAETASRKTEAEKLRVQLDDERQLDIIRNTLQTQEEERRRIAESLHNGLGQILYGIKITLSDLDQQLATEDFEKNKAYINKLLTESIQESRRISHELTPATLDAFGLKAAIEDICQQLRGGIKVTCKVTGLNKRLENYLELAVYRTVQELMFNVVKHAQATKALVELRVSGTIILIRLTDDGKGFQVSKKEKPGIGLASIHSKIKLLNGNVDIRTAENGTTVEVTIPIPESNNLA